jgi:hypothetical protein
MIALPLSAKSITMDIGRAKHIVRENDCACCSFMSIFVKGVWGLNVEI